MVEIKIKGVQIKPLKFIPDERGFLMEMLRDDDPIFKGFGQIYVTGVKKGVAKGWHYHKKQTDTFVCIEGKALVPLVDFRKDSPTYKVAQDFVIEAPPDAKEPLLLQIPPFVLHGFTPYKCDFAKIINIPSLHYIYGEPDEFRYPWNSPEVPYKWPKEVKGGG
jgi:dTDP-4-dehydrorhamnose 3,5-epimerase